MSRKRLADTEETKCQIERERERERERIRGRGERPSKTVVIIHCCVAKMKSVPI